MMATRPCVLAKTSVEFSFTSEIWRDSPRAVRFSASSVLLVGAKVVPQGGDRHVWNP